MKIKVTTITTEEKEIEVDFPCYRKYEDNPFTYAVKILSLKKAIEISRNPYGFSVITWTSEERINELLQKRECDEADWIASVINLSAEAENFYNQHIEQKEA